ncbi:hypothetical protein SCREM2_gp117 [Synechococcus phage S-CREM2]|nr:hypothetical protein SCREM2_gp117 [Synechococcus phage S-CREM2]
MLVLTDKGSIKRYPYTLSQLKRDNPHVSFPAVPPPQLLEEFGVYRVSPKKEPEVDPGTHSVIEVSPKNVDGEWVQNWLVHPHSEERLEELRSKAATASRERRSLLLAQSDWTQVADAPVDAAAWRSYRTELRDITKQEGFPNNIKWPVPPSN